MKHSLSISLARQLGVLVLLHTGDTKDIISSCEIGDWVMGGFVKFEDACMECPDFIKIPDMRFGILPALHTTEAE